MKITKIQIENYRLLKDVSIDLEDELSLVIGKNNTGKTSILSALEKFLNPSDRNKIYFDDFNIDFKNEIKKLIEEDTISENEYHVIGIKLRLFIQYSETCNLGNICRVMMDLDPDNNYIVLGFEYLLTFGKYVEIRKDFQEFQINENEKQKERKDYKKKTLNDFLGMKHSDYFKMYRKSIEIDKDTKFVNETNFIDLDNEKISINNIINFKLIPARRDVANKDIDKTLSMQTSKIYEKAEINRDQNMAVEAFKNRLVETDAQLSEIYVDLFKTIVKKVGDLGGIKPNESKIEIISNLQHQELLKGNTTVVYKHDDDNKLPEHYNGLGYMNLIYMIFEIEILIQEFKREKEKCPADINLLFIEEPEAHTHPQMQYIFIKNIKRLLQEGIQRDDGENRKLQYIISTHSSHIVANSDFDDIKYLRRSNNNSVVVKNLKDLKTKYEKETQQYQFLKQYLTISRAEIFFADKAILIEGDTERMLMPAMMKKLDIEERDINHTGLPLLSQNISIIEVGAYSQIFDEFINFLGIKTLIITDLDTIDKNGKKSEVERGESCSNGAIAHYFNKSIIADLKKYSMQNKILGRNETNKIWTEQHAGNLCVVYQTEENGYHARSFEDAFIHLNSDFVKENKNTFRGLKNRDDFDVSLSESPYNLAKNCVNKKTHFALDILFHSNETLNNWKIPAYIKEGLLWLKQDE
jgi:predicted ATP-dependent endonuclease of OLD family